MKRVDQLIPLSKEHYQSLVLAKRCKNIAAKEGNDVIQRFVLQLQEDFETQWTHHFEIEEKLIFRLADTKSSEMSEMCQQLSEEHQAMKNMVKRIAAGEYQLLHEFGQLLHDHTRQEERVLFPMVEQQFSKEELDKILGIVN